MISAWELLQAAVLVVTVAGVAAACERWGSKARHADAASAPSHAKRRAAAQAHESDDDVAEPALPPVRGNEPSPAEPDAPKKDDSSSSPDATSAAAPAPAAPEAEDEDLDALLDSALDAEAEADHLLDDILDEGANADRKEKGDAAGKSQQPAEPLPPRPEDPRPATARKHRRDAGAKIAENSGDVAQSLTGVRTKPARTGSQAAPASCKVSDPACRTEENTSGPSRKERQRERERERDSMDDLIDSALDEVGHSDALLDECLESAAKASAPSANDRPAAAVPARKEESVAERSPDSDKSAREPKLRGAGTSKRRSGSGNRGLHNSSSGGEHDPSRPDLVFPAAMRTAKRPAPDHARAAELMRMGRELLELRKHQAALDTLCSAHRFVNLEHDDGLRNAIKTGVRMIYVDRDEESKFNHDALPHL